MSYGEGARLARLMYTRCPQQDPLRVFLCSLDMVQARILSACGYELGEGDHLLETPAMKKYVRPEFMDRMSFAVSTRVDSAVRGFEQPLPWRAALHPITVAALTPLEHLWMCMIAHIGYDIPSSLAASDMRDPRDHEGDYRLTAELLENMIDDVQLRIREVWPAARWLDALLGRADEHITNRLVGWSRELAWQDGIRIRTTTSQLRPRALRELALRCVFLQTQLVGASFVPLKLAGFLH